MKTDSFVLIVGAVFQEIQPIIEKLNAFYKKTIGKRQIFCGKLFNQSVVIVQSGIGMLNAVQTVTAIIEKMPVHLIINTGCAGAFPNAGISIGDIGIATKETDIHFGIEGVTPHDPVEQLSIPLIQTAYAQYYGSYPVSEQYCNMAYDVLSKDFLFKNSVVKLMPFITVSTITSTAQRMNRLFNSYQAGMENMEGAGIAHVALLYNKPFLEIRAASNFVGERDKRKWKMTEAFERSANSVLLLIKNLSYEQEKK